MYRGRIAPSPTGYLHIGHAVTFWRAQERARQAGGKLVLRIEDLDRARCRPEFREAIMEDLKWFGLEWDEGPDSGGPFAPYLQSERREFYLDAWEKLRGRGWIYPCHCSRKDVIGAAFAPHDEWSRREPSDMEGQPERVASREASHQNEEPVYPGTCRPSLTAHPEEEAKRLPAAPAGVNWRFRVPDGEQMRFDDGRLGRQRAVAGRDFGDFIVWRKDDVPAYQLAVVVDDAAMQISEVVRGEDLLTSTFRQLLIYRALTLEPPAFYHTPLLRDEQGQRLAKRHASLSLRELRQAGAKPEEMRERFNKGR
jgi:glutamyl/glutaminyl-tRNA synthetase